MNSLQHRAILFHSFADRASLVETLKAATLSKLERAIAEKGSATWAVSGGSTPAPLFEAMTETSFQWSKVHVALVDERWVPQGHARSNERLIHNTLLKGHAATARFEGMYRDMPSAQSALGSVEAAYGQLPHPFANVLLGLGSDGHTASLFPEAEGLDAALAPDYFALCAAIKAKKSDVTGDETERMTLTLNALKQAQSCFLMITGDEKLTTLRNALEQNTYLPIARVVHALKQPLEVFWSP